jgi:hypothetical protein
MVLSGNILSTIGISFIDFSNAGIYTSTTLSTNPRSVVNIGFLDNYIATNISQRIQDSSTDYVEVDNNTIDFVINNSSRM